jgi:hypothetical protein
MSKKTKSKAKRLATLDAETDPFKFQRVPMPFVWGIYFGDGDYDYFWGDDCTEQLIEYLNQDVEDLCIYAHNGGKFDYFFLLSHITGSTKIINGRISKANLFTHELRDSYNIIPMPLSAYKKDEFDYAKMERPVREKNKQDILRYLRKDCEYLYELVESFEEQFGRNLTIASTAFKEVKKTGYDVPTTYEEYDNVFRPFYIGGRVQCFEVGAIEGPLEFVDINSAYPKAMLERHPCDGRFTEHLRLPTKKGMYFAIIDAISKGALPFRGSDGKLVFPDDDMVRTYHTTSWEILAGLDTSTLTIINVRRVYKHVYYNDFNDYVAHWYDQKRSCKESGDKKGELFAKLMLNSAYGKFGQDGRKFEEFEILPYGDWPEGDGWSPYSTIECDKDYQIFSRADPSFKFFNVATAASITGCVRASMWRALCASDRPIYCDTDSIICKKFNGELGPEIGKWSYEGILSEAYIAQKKMYAVKMVEEREPDFVGPLEPVTKKACKGVNLTFEQIKNGVLKCESIVTSRDAPNFSLKKDPSFLSRTTNFENYQENHLQLKRDFG